MPLVWSGCRCDISTTSMLLGSTPAAGKILQRAADRALARLELAIPLPQSIRISLLPVLMSCGLNGTVTMPFGI